MVNFERLIQAAKNPEMKRNALKGFAERQTEREKRFAEQAKARTPSAAWYERSYNI